MSPSTRPGLTSPLATWFADEDAVTRFRRRRLSRTPAILHPRDRAWRELAPGFDEAVALARSGVPFQVAAERRYDRSGDPRGLDRALGAGATVFLPQAHQLLPRIARLMVALRHTFCGPFREECSFLFVVEGTGRAGMGLHHDGEADSFWLQLNGRRTVTIGPPVEHGTPLDLDDRLAAGAVPVPVGATGRRRPPRSSGRAERGGPGPAVPPWWPTWWTVDLAPGTLFHLPPRTPHRVVCHGRSLAVSLTWGPRSRRHGTSGRRTALAAWDVASGYVDGPVRPSRDRVFVQVPAVAERPRADGRARLWTADGGAILVPGRPRRVLDALGGMPSLTRRAAGPLLGPLLEAGIVGPADLPLRIRPEDPRALDGWRFA